MAKGLRSSTRKRNKAELRAKVFGPAADERTARLSAKLQELVNTTKDSTMTDSSSKDASNQIIESADAPKEMEIDGQLTTHKRSERNGRIQKRTRQKPRNRIAFAPPPSKVKRLKK
ncbi:hypothetical protein FQN57_003061 [Myotisia sp. PD_48]|nr:hypothetical protein FQN57_003061 [Myotisia sp. PD_48]